MNVSTLVVLFNSDIMSSSTINSLFGSEHKSVKLKIIIWNNGPRFLSEDDVKKFSDICNEKSIKFEIYEDIRNISLSKIYNHFLNKENFDFFTILDQDSSLDNGFFNNLKEHSLNDIILPKILDINKYSNQTNPMEYHSRKLIQDGKFNTKIVGSIGSGLTISKPLSFKIKEKFGCLFDERYVLYYCDYSFFLRLKQLDDINGYCCSFIFHSESAGSRYDQMSETTKLELGYLKILRNLEERRNFIRNLASCLRYKIRTKSNFDTFIKLVKCAYFKKHPRADFSIKFDVKPNYQS